MKFHWIVKRILNSNYWYGGYEIRRSDGKLFAECPSEAFADQIAVALNALESNLKKGI